MVSARHMKGMEYARSALNRADCTAFFLTLGHYSYIEGITFAKSSRHHPVFA